MVERILPLNTSKDFNGYKRGSINENGNDWTMKTNTSDEVSLNLTSRTVADQNQTPTKGRMIQTTQKERWPREQVQRKPTCSDYAFDPESPMMKQKNNVTIQSSNVSSKCMTSIAGPRLTDHY
jgi:hypothetical protein